MGLLDMFKKNGGSESPQAQPHLTADEVLERGKALESLGDMEAAFRAYLQAAEMGDPEAMTKVGHAYLYKHHGAPFDLKKSAEWYEKAAKGGSIPAMMMLSQCYLAGAGVAESDEIAKQWLECAIDKSKRVGKTRMIEIATSYLNDMAGTKQTLQALYATATEMGGIPRKK